MPFLVSPVPVSDADWPRFLDAARDVAGQAGMTELTVQADTPGNHVAQLRGGDGNVVRVSSARNALLSGTTGCRLSKSNPTG